jgi:ubiquinone/menaquinone biosynthesis C-methylase UbiE
MAHVCPWWFCYTFDNPLRRLVHDPVKMLAPFVGAGATCLDVGCGMGYFTLGLARLVGASGRVLAVDLQQKMLDTLMRRATKAGVAKAIEPRRCAPDSLGLADVAGTVDFALCFWMLHEVPDMAGFLEQIAAALKPGGTLLVAEPRFHVKRDAFDAELRLAEGLGWAVMQEPAIWGSHAALLRAPEQELRAANYQAGRGA